MRRMPQLDAPRCSRGNKLYVTFITALPPAQTHPRGFFLRAIRPSDWLPLLVWKRSADVATGTVKWFNATKGYGFIQPDGGGKDVFVHISAVEKAGFTGLAEGAKISYEVVTDRGKESAGNLRL